MNTVYRVFLTHPFLYYEQRTNMEKRASSLLANFKAQQETDELKKTLTEKERDLNERYNQVHSFLFASPFLSICQRRTLV